MRRENYISKGISISKKATNTPTIFKLIMLLYNFKAIYI
jgi:hypothetical protein